jgi:hypothetical protein
MNHSDDDSGPAPSVLPVSGGERPDLSSLHVREDVALSGLCGNVHLATGPDLHPARTPPGLLQLRGAGGCQRSGALGVKALPCPTPRP